MGDRTKIDWCDSTWNPVTGCLHKCEYCYARGIARRFAGGEGFEGKGWYLPEFDSDIHHLKKPAKLADGTNAPYPFGFAPTFHAYRMMNPEIWKTPRNIFVCSMADLFGDWVPEEWIRRVLEVCRETPRHRYLFLTKNPRRYGALYDSGALPDGDGFWYGSTATQDHDPYFCSRKRHTFLSIEPIMQRIDVFHYPEHMNPEWIIVGAETGNRKGRVVPEKGWIMEIADGCRERGIPVFMKESLRTIMEEDFRQEFPWEKEGETK